MSERRLSLFSFCASRSPAVERSCAATLRTTLSSHSWHPAKQSQNLFPDPKHASMQQPKFCMNLPQKPPQPADCPQEAVEAFRCLAREVKLWARRPGNPETPHLLQKGLGLWVGPWDI